MPLYEYECKCGNVFEDYAKLKDYDKPQKCPLCGKRARKIMSLGGIEGEEPVWLDSACRTLQNQPEVRAGRQKKIESRSEMKRYMKERHIEHLD